MRHAPQRRRRPQPHQACQLPHRSGHVKQWPPLCRECSWSGHWISSTQYRAQRNHPQGPLHTYSTPDPSGPATSSPPKLAVIERTAQRVAILTASDAAYTCDRKGSSQRFPCTPSLTDHPSHPPEATLPYPRPSNRHPSYTPLHRLLDFGGKGVTASRLSKKLSTYDKNFSHRWMTPWLLDENDLSWVGSGFTGPLHLSFPREHFQAHPRAGLVGGVGSRVCVVDAGPSESRPASPGLYGCCIERVTRLDSPWGGGCWGND